MTPWDDTFEVIAGAADFELTRDQLQRKYGFSKGNAVFEACREEESGGESHAGAAIRKHGEDQFPFDDETSFEVESDTLLVGDPVMGMQRYDVSHLSPGFYRFERGAIFCADREEAVEKGLPLIVCDCVFLYVVDADYEEEFQAMFERYDDVTEFIDDLAVINDELGVEAAVYESQGLIGQAIEGCYLLEVTKIVPVDDEEE